MLGLGSVSWDESSSDDKIERLRMELDAWRGECAILRQRLAYLEHHQHGQTGELLIPVRDIQILDSQNCASSWNSLK
jgi:hypothetical protein